MKKTEAQAILLAAVNQLYGIDCAEMASKVMDIYLDSKIEDRICSNENTEQCALDMSIVLEEMWPQNWHSACETNLIDCRMSRLAAYATRAGQGDIVEYIRDQEFYRIKAEDCEDYDRYDQDDIKKFVTETQYMIEPLLPDWDGVRGSSGQIGMK